MTSLNQQFVNTPKKGMNKSLLLTIGLVIFCGLLLAGCKKDEGGMTQIDPPNTAIVPADTPAADGNETSGTDGGQPYTLKIGEGCSSHTFSFAPIANNQGTDVGVYYVQDGVTCEGIWEFDFGVGALLANVRPDLDERSFTLIRQEGDVINIAALQMTTGWTIAAHEGGELGKWFGALPAVLAKAGDMVTVTFQNAEGNAQITLTFDFTQAGMVTISEV